MDISITYFNLQITTYTDTLASTRWSEVKDKQLDNTSTTTFSADSKPHNHHYFHCHIFILLFGNASQAQVLDANFGALLICTMFMIIKKGNYD